MILKGNGFILRPWKKGDETSLTKNANNKKIWINLTHTFPHPYTIRDAKKWVKFSNKRLIKNQEKTLIKKSLRLFKPIF